MSRMHTFEVGLGNRFLVWFLDTKKIEVRQGEGRICMIDHPYTPEQTRVLDLWQSADVLFVGHLEHPLMALAHFTDRDWRWMEANQIVPSAPLINAPGWVAVHGYGMPEPRRQPVTANEKLADKFDCALFRLIGDAGVGSNHTGEIGKKWGEIVEKLAEIRPLVRAMMAAKDRRETVG